VREYLLTVLTAVVVTYLLTPMVRKFAVAFGAMTEVRDRDVHAIPTPRMGGLAMFGGMVAALVVASQLPQLQKVFEGNDTWRALLLGGGLIVAIGVADDRWGVDALTKLAGQVAAAGILIMNGVQVLWIPLPGGEPLSLPPEYGVPLTVFLVVATINAVNFIDGLDGLAAGVVGIAASAVFTYSYVLSAVNGLNRQTGPTMISAVLIGMCVGFLSHNFHPARIFMGDTGSMLIGMLLSASTITLTGQVDPNAISYYNMFPLIVPLMVAWAVVAVPFVDMLLAVWRRTNQGRSPFAPDKQHLHHRLLDIGHSHRRAVLIMYFWVAVLAFGVVGMSTVRPVAVVITITAGVAVVGIVGMVAAPRLWQSGQSAGPSAAAKQPRQPV
jgi:UDP-GlcNAc:undecaprenyl-phosphate GlcNAc-1-phosphate transferase